MTSTDGFNAIYFDCSTGAIFTEAEVCVVVDADRDGIVDGTQTAVSRLHGLHFVGNAFVLENIRIDDIYACLTVSSLSPLVASPPPSTTTTTTASTIAALPTTTTTTIPACATARDCLGEIKANVDCPEGLPGKLGTIIDRKVAAARTKLDKARHLRGVPAERRRSARPGVGGDRHGEVLTRLRLKPTRRASVRRAPRAV